MQKDLIFSRRLDAGLRQEKYQIFLRTARFLGSVTNRVGTRSYSLSSATWPDWRCFWAYCDYVIRRTLIGSVTIRVGAIFHSQDPTLTAGQTATSSARTRFLDGCGMAGRPGRRVVRGLADFQAARLRAIL